MKLCKPLWLAVGLAASASAGCADSGGVREGAPSPSFALEAADGSVVRSDALLGQPVLVSFWSTSCGPCIKEVPELQQLDDGRQVKVLGVALDPSGWTAVRPFVAKHRITYRVLLGGEEVFKKFDGYSLPYSVLLDGSQRVVKVYRGAVTKVTVERDARAVTGG